MPYGEDEIEIKVEDKQVQTILHPRDVEKKDERKLVKDALNSPIERPKFSDFIEDGTLFIVNDAMRPTPTSFVLEIMKREIEKHDVEFIVATGSHRKPTEEEFKWIFGDLYSDLKENIHYHDAKNDDMIGMGMTEKGTKVEFNKILEKAKNVVTINTVEPHYFAGFTGGRKSFLPGIASYQTITENHYYSLKKGSKALKLKGNPIHEDMLDAIDMLEFDIFAINMTLDKDGDIFSACAGDLEKSFKNEVKNAKEIFAPEIDNKSEVVVVGAHPMDMDLYQSHKAIEFGKLAMKDGGILILVSKCSNGIGPDNFYKLMTSCNSTEEITKKVEEEYKLGYQKAVKIANLKSRGSIWAVTNLDDEELKNVFMESKNDIQEAIELAISKTSGQITFIPKGGTTVPKIK